MRPEWLLEMPYEEYHAARAQYMTSHALADFAKSPRNYRLRELGQLPRPDSPAFAAGRAFHTMMESPDLFAATYTVADGPVNPKTGNPFGTETKAYAEWAASITGPVVSTAEATMYRAMRDSALAHGKVQELLGREHYNEGVVRRELAGVWCQCRPDAYAPDAYALGAGGAIVDWKTCDDIAEFERKAKYAYDYVWQMAFYMACCGGLVRGMSAYLVAVEKQPPYTCGVWLVDRDAVVNKCNHLYDALADYGECCRTGEWPTRYEQVRVLA